MRKKKIQTNETVWTDPLDCSIPNVCYSLIKDPDVVKAIKPKTKKLYKEQRLTRGFDDSEVWDLRTAASKFLLPRLRCLRESYTGHPAAITEKKWKENLDEIIWMLEETISDDSNNALYHKYYDDDNNLRAGMSSEDWMAEIEKLNRRVNHACYLLGKYFQDFWD